MPMKSKTLRPLILSISGQDAAAQTGPAMPAEFQEPPVAFTPWCLWTQRDSLDGSDAPGIYVLAHFEAEPPARTDALDQRVVYIGETCKTLSGQLWEFNQTAMFRKGKHGGGWSYSRRCTDAGDNLCVAGFPVADLPEPHRSVFIRYTQRRLLWEYVARWGRMPVCNSK